MLFNGKSFYRFSQPTSMYSELSELFTRAICLFFFVKFETKNKSLQISLPCFISPQFLMFEVTGDCSMSDCCERNPHFVSRLRFILRSLQNSLTKRDKKVCFKKNLLWMSKKLVGEFHLLILTCIKTCLQILRLSFGLAMKMIKNAIVKQQIF